MAGRVLILVSESIFWFLIFNYVVILTTTLRLFRLLWVAALLNIDFLSFILSGVCVCVSILNVVRFCHYV